MEIAQMKQRWLLLNSMPYKILDEKTGLINEGVSIRCLSDFSFKPASKGDGKGVRQLKSTLPLEFLPKITFAPALYDFTFEMNADSNGNPKIEIMDLEFVSTFNVTHVPNPAEKAPAEKAK